MDLFLIFIVIIIVLALVFDFTNGFHDAANSIATVVSTRVLSPKQAVIWAAFFNFIAFLIFGTAVATTVGKGMIDISKVDVWVIFAGLFLLVINIYGLFRTMRNPAVYSEEKTLRNRINDISIKYPDIKELLKRMGNESNIDFAVRINKVVNDGFIHYWKPEGIEKYHLRVPVWENWMLYLASYISPKTYKY